MKMMRYAIAIAAVALFAIQSAMALDAKLEVVVEGVNAPMMMTSPNDGTKRLFIVEQTGKIKILGADGKLVAEPFLDISAKLVKQHDFFDERGLLSMAFHPKYKENGKFYVYYSSPLKSEDLGEKLWWSHTNQVVEFKVSADANKADPNSERAIISQNWPQFNHNGGQINFGPDGYLYIHLGDGGFADDYGIGHNKTEGNGQDLTVLLGKILRIDVNSGNPYGVPKDNPFLKTKGARPEIFAYGLRNPWRGSFDMGGKHEYIVADVGQNSFEEVNIVVKGGNYGWRRMEGDHCFDWTKPNNHPKSCNKKDLVQPIMQYNNCNVTKDCQGLSITGGYVYRGKNKAWDGIYFFGDWSSTFGTKNGKIFAGVNKGGKWKMENVKVTNMPKFDSYVLGFGQDLDGEVYVMTTDTTGPTGNADKIYRIVP